MPTWHIGPINGVERAIEWAFLDITFYALQEARVRFAGFDKGEDEWVSVRKGIRERSIPLEPSECHRVHTGDLVLCFQVPFIFELAILSPILFKKLYHMLITGSLQFRENITMTILELAALSHCYASNECPRIFSFSFLECVLTCDSVQERLNQAVYCDAHIMEIRRKLHDGSSCTCVFIVRYDHDFSQVRAKKSHLAIL